MNHPDDLTPQRGKQADAWRTCAHCGSALGYIFANGQRQCTNCGRPWRSKAEHEKRGKQHGR